VILPQLAATGVLALEVFRRTRWSTRFGPAHMRDLPAYLVSGEKTDAMRRVLFPLGDRLQMALMWAAPIVLVVGGLTLWAKPTWAGPLVLLVAGMSVAVFTLYDRLGAARGFKLAGASTLIALAAIGLAGGGPAALAAAVLAPALLTALLTFDYTGSTPLEGGSHFEERRWSITLDESRCEGVFRCWEVCPEACFERRDDERKVALAHEERCIRCGACVVQCPMDALFFQNEEGARIEPDVVRRYKLNLLGRRSVGVAE
jgi:NAD-dependent dihydropyrimidine dehydrogenase PreA subunit